MRKQQLLRVVWKAQSPNLVSYQRERSAFFSSQPTNPHRGRWRSSSSPPHLDGGVQRGLVQLLELRFDVQQVELRPTHHDSGQGGLVSSAALTTSRARVNLTTDTETLSHVITSVTQLHVHLHALIQEFCEECGDAVHTFHWKKKESRG